MTDLKTKPVEVDDSLYCRCQYCGRQLKRWFYRCIGYCRTCYCISFQVRRTKLPPIRMRTRTGWQRLLSFGEIDTWRKWQEAIIERVDRENATAKDAKGAEEKKQK